MQSPLTVRQCHSQPSGWDNYFLADQRKRQLNKCTSWGDKAMHVGSLWHFNGEWKPCVAQVFISDQSMCYHSHLEILNLRGCRFAFFLPNFLLDSLIRTALLVSVSCVPRAPCRGSGPRSHLSDSACHLPPPHRPPSLYWLRQTQRLLANPF